MSDQGNPGIRRFFRTFPTPNRILRALGRMMWADADHYLNDHPEEVPGD